MVQDRPERPKPSLGISLTISAIIGLGWDLPEAPDSDHTQLAKLFHFCFTVEIVTAPLDLERTVIIKVQTTKCNDE